MNRKRLFSAAAVAALLGLALAPTPTWAGTATASLSVSATVAANCTITAGTLAFGSYDPVVANASTDLSGSGTFTVACTKSASGVYVGLGLGANASGSTRRMISGANYLTYELYKDNSASPTVWGNTSTTGMSYSPTSKTATTLTVYGKVTAGQDVAVGSYTDTVVMTVNF